VNATVVLENTFYWGYEQPGCTVMNCYIMTKRKSKHPKPAQKQEKPASVAFDVWLQRGLHQLYDEVAKEPVPDELLKLIEEDRQK